MAAFQFTATTASKTHHQTNGTPAMLATIDNAIRKALWKIGPIALAILLVLGNNAHLPLFSGSQSLISKETEQKLRAWTESAPSAAPIDLQKQAQDYATQGTTAYAEYWGH
jgi:hypothetical protein